MGTLERLTIILSMEHGFTTMEFGCQQILHLTYFSGRRPKHNMVEIKLKKNQTGYDVVAEFIKRYWEHHITDQIVVSLGLSRDGITFEHHNEVASPYNFDDIEFDYDWWEGEQYIRIFGITSVNKLNIAGGIYDK